jgi:hypothetical protein
MDRNKDHQSIWNTGNALVESIRALTTRCKKLGIDVQENDGNDQESLQKEVDLQEVSQHQHRTWNKENCPVPVAKRNCRFCEDQNCLENQVDSDDE